MFSVAVQKAMSLLSDEGDLPGRLSRWIGNEIPSIEVPPDEVLQSIVQGPAARELWEFVVERVRSKGHIEEFRKSLVLFGESEGNDSHRSTQEDRNENNTWKVLRDTEEEARQLEEQLDQLRRELLERDSVERYTYTPLGISEEALQGSLYIVAQISVDDLNTHIQKIAEFVDNEFPVRRKKIKSSPNARNGDERRGADDADAKESIVEEVAASIKEAQEILSCNDYENAAEVIMQQTRLTSHVLTLCKNNDVHEVANALTMLVSLACETLNMESELNEEESNHENKCDNLTNSDSVGAQISTKELLRTLQDKYMEAFHSNERIEVECLKAEQAFTEEVKALEAKLSGEALQRRLLHARLHGERAAQLHVETLITNCRNGKYIEENVLVNDKEVLESTRAKLNLVEKNDLTIGKLSDSIASLVKENSKHLEHMTHMASLLDAYAQNELPALQSETKEFLTAKAVKLASVCKMLLDNQSLMQELGNVFRLNNNTAHETGEEQVLEELLEHRRKVDEKHEEKVRRSLGDLRVRVNATMHAIDDARKNEKYTLLPMLEKAADVGEQWLSNDASKARIEVQQWLSPPARNVTPWIKKNGLTLKQWEERAYYRHGSG